MSQKNIPFDFVLDYLFPLEVTVKPMFGLHAIYIGNRIVLMLRNKNERTEMNGVWVATTEMHHASLKQEFPALISISELSDETMQSGWQVIPASSADFETSVINICILIKNGDPRIGKAPAPRNRKRKQ